MFSVFTKVFRAMARLGSSKDPLELLMHLSDTLVIGPLPLGTRHLRVPVGMALALGVAAVVAITAACTGAAPRLLGNALAPLAARLGVAFPETPATPAPVDERPQVEVRLTSVPAGAAIVADGQVVGTTPTTISATAGQSLVLRRPGAPDVVVLDPRADVPIPVWPRASLLPVRPPLPGSAITDLQLLGDGRLGLAVASLVGPNERQAWIFDPAQASLQRIGPAVRENAPPAGEVVAPDGQHAMALVRGAAATPNSAATPDSLLLNGPEGRRPLLADVLASDERGRDLSWAPDSRSALLVTQRPLPGYSRGTNLFQLRVVPLGGPTRDLVDLPIAPMEGSWVWAPDGHAVAWVVRTTPPALATLDLTSASLRSVADVPAQMLPGQGAVAPAAWAADGTLLFAAPRPMDPAARLPTPGPAAATPRALPSSILQVLAPGRTDPHPLGDGVAVLAAPAFGPRGNSLLALVAAADGTLQLETLDLHGHAVATQAIGVGRAGALSLRWDLAHAQVVLMQAAAAGGIDARVLRLDGTGNSEVPQ